MVPNRAAEDDLSPARGQGRPAHGHLNWKTVGSQHNPIVSVTGGAHTVMLKPVAGDHRRNLLPSDRSRRFDPVQRR
jgi:hypothetical protein